MLTHCKTTAWMNQIASGQFHIKVSCYVLWGLIRTHHFNGTYKFERDAVKAGIAFLDAIDRRKK